MRLNDHDAPDTEQWNVADAESILRSHGCRATQPRVAVMRSMLRHGGPIDAARLTELAQAENPRIHEATVYRTINVLSDRGIVTHVHAGHGPSLIRLGGDHELIAVCRDCGVTSELPNDVVARFVRDTRDAIGFTLEPGHFALEGVCRRCETA